jgi:hypothetical protein
MTGAPAQPGGPPVPAPLQYRLDDEIGWSLEVRLILAAALVSSVFSLITFGTSMWIWLQPARFRTLGGFPSLRSTEFALGASRALVDMAVVAGVAAVFARHRVGRALLV